MLEYKLALITESRELFVDENVYRYQEISHMIMHTESEQVLDLISKTLDAYYEGVMDSIFSEKADFDKAKDKITVIGKKIAAKNDEIAHKITRKVPETNKDGSYRVNFNTDYDQYAKRVRRTETALLAAEIPVAMNLLPKPLDLILIGGVTSNSPAGKKLIERAKELKENCAKLIQKVRDKKIDNKVAVTQMKTLNMQIAKVGESLQTT